MVLIMLIRYPSCPVQSALTLVSNICGNFSATLWIGRCRLSFWCSVGSEWMLNLNYRVAFTIHPPNCVKCALRAGTAENAIGLRWSRLAGTQRRHCVRCIKNHIPERSCISSLVACLICSLNTAIGHSFGLLWTSIPLFFFHSAHGQHNASPMLVKIAM